MARSYHPQGKVQRVDVFYCTPLHHVESGREKWLEEHLLAWRDFSREEVAVWECEGDHADMLNPTYVEGFAERLNGALEARGV